MKHFASISWILKELEYFFCDAWRLSNLNSLCILNGYEANGGTHLEWDKNSEILEALSSKYLRPLVRRLGFEYVRWLAVYPPSLSGCR